MLSPTRDFQSGSDSAVTCRPGELWSLWDIMMNYQIFGICHLLQALWMEQQEFRQRIALLEAQRAGRSLGAALGMGVADNPTDQDRERIKGWLQYATQQANQLELQAAHDRIARFTGKLRFPMTLQAYVAEVTTLLETFQDGINFKYFYKYPQAKALMLLKAEPEWKKITDAFPECKQDSISAVDCYALGQNTASVFHAMRVAEHGLRALAKERKVTLPRNRQIEWATWQDLIKALDAEILAIGNKKAGAPRDAALEFYSGARADLNGFKDEYRNLVMHVRASYDEFQALEAVQKVHAFMERVAVKIDHRHHRIRWGLR
jgi:hypothetical protein